MEISKLILSFVFKVNPYKWEKTLIAYPTLLVEVVNMMIPRNSNGKVSEEQKRAPFS